MNESQPLPTNLEWPISGPAGQPLMKAAGPIGRPSGAVPSDAGTNFYRLRPSHANTHPYESLKGTFA